MKKRFAGVFQDLAAIPDGTYEGYYWLSDSPEPNKISSVSDLNQLKSYSGNPFVMEALLYDRTANLSVHVRHTGNYQVTLYNWNQFDEQEIFSGSDDEVVFLPQKIEGIKGLKFARIWRKEPDELCEGKEVLKMNALVFCGFKI